GSEVSIKVSLMPIMMRHRGYLLTGVHHTLVCQVAPTLCCVVVAHIKQWSWVIPVNPSSAWCVNFSVCVCICIYVCVCVCVCVYISDPCHYDYLLGWVCVCVCVWVCGCVGLCVDTRVHLHRE